MSDLITRLSSEIHHTVTVDILHQECIDEITRLKAELAEMKDRWAERMDKCEELKAELAAAQQEIAELKAKVSWLQGDGSIVGYPWDAPYNDGYETAKDQFRAQLIEAEDNLAASQAREMKLRTALEFAHDILDHNDNYAYGITDALAQPTDNSALREVCMRVAALGKSRVLFSPEAIVDEVLESVSC